MNIIGKYDKKENPNWAKFMQSAEGLKGESPSYMC